MPWLWCLMGTFDIVRQRDAATSSTGVRTWRHATAVSGKRRLAHPEPAILRMARGYALCFTQSGNVNYLLKDGADSRVREFPYFYSKRGVLGCATTFQGGPMAQTLATAPATSLPWAWRLFRAPDSDDERFLIAFLHAQSQDPSGQDWNCDEVARTEDEARAYALQFGVSPSSFTSALEHLRARLAAGNTA